MPTYYTDRAAHDAVYRAKQNKRRKIIAAAVLVAAVILDLLIYFLCPETISTIINVGGEPLVVDKLMFVIGAGILELVLSFIAFVNEEKRLSFIVWTCFFLLLMLIIFIRNI